jgi:Family of unknown function (DUF6448)
MIVKMLNRGSYRIFASVLLIGAVAISALFTPKPASAHCDSEKGPVAQAALKALEVKDVNLVLPYVQPEAEAELTVAFKQALEVRKEGGTSKELADRYFMETAIRLHRLGEGASYEGVTDEAVPQPILTADKAMQTGSMESLYKMLDEAIRDGVAEKYKAVVEARQEAARLGTVEAYRELAESELIFEKYIYELYGAAVIETPHAEGQTASHAH